MAQLAIKGHATRGKEIIEILEMLGGKNKTHIKAKDKNVAYCISEDGQMYGACTYRSKSNLVIYPLEEFLEKFPYKVGDKVSAFGNKCTIINAVWDGSINEVDYTIKLDTSEYITTKLSNQLQPYEETPMYLNEKVNRQTEEIKKTIEPVKEIMEEIKIDIPDGYEFFGIDDDSKIVLTKKQLRYPKTYEECCKVLSLGEDSKLYTKGYKASIIQGFQKLLICRDAYWKIAGEEMGLDKPLEPDWNKSSQFKGVIICRSNNIIKYASAALNTILAFPTAEMRDAFYENFKDLIEECKEFL